MSKIDPSVKKAHNLKKKKVWDGSSSTQKASKSFLLDIPNGAVTVLRSLWIILVRVHSVFTPPTIVLVGFVPEDDDDFTFTFAVVMNICI